MRERNVFGKKINRVSFVIILVVLFLVLIGARYGMLAILQTRLSALEAEREDLERRIEAVVAASESIAYHEIADIVDELPDAYDQLGIAADLAAARGIAGIVAPDYVETFEDDAVMPFEDDLSDDLRAVRITVSMTVDDADRILAYLEAVEGLDRIFHVESASVDMLSDGAYVSFRLYAFYLEAE